MMFDYAASAELFIPKRKSGVRQPLSYRRFATAAEAIRFAVEELPALHTLGAWMQVGEERFNGSPPPKADISLVRWDVCFVPKADITGLLGRRERAPTIGLPIVPLDIKGLRIFQ